MDVVFEQAGLAAVGVVGPAVVDECGLQERVERFAVRGDCETFEPLVVGAAGLRICGYGDAGGVVDRGAVGGEGDATVAARQVGGWGLDGGEEGSRGGEVVDVRAVFVADPVGAIFGEDETFGVEACAVAAGARLAEAVACVGCCGEEGVAGDGEATLDVGIETGGRGAGGVGQEGCGFVLEEEVRWRGFGEGGIGGRGEGDGEFVDAVLVIEGALGVP